MLLVLRCFCALACLLCSAEVSISQTKSPTGNLKISVDYSRFRYDDKEVYVEFYYSFPQRMLTYVPDGAGYKAGVDLIVSIGANDSLVYADHLLVPHVSIDTAVNAMSLISLSNTKLPAGKYRMKVIARDQNNKTRMDSVMLDLPIKILPTDKPVLSDIEFASSVKRGKQGSLFYKNTLEVIPHPDGIYTPDQTCAYYVEAYNLTTNGDTSDYTLKTSVYNSLGREIISREQSRKRQNESSVLVGNVDVTKLSSGTYTLFLSLVDTSKKTFAAIGKKFFVYNAGMGVDSTFMSLDPSIGAGIFATMSEAQLDQEFKWAKWEAQANEKNQYESLKGLDVKRKFMTDFWSRRPLGLRDEYLKRVAAANSMYNVMAMPGYRTDRGRVHIMYGPPDDIERHPNESGSRPYEIWSFNSIQGGVIFVFLLRQNGGDYELVHSTHRNELHDENWLRYANTN